MRSTSTSENQALESSNQCVSQSVTVICQLKQFVVDSVIVTQLVVAQSSKQCPPTSSVLNIYHTVVAACGKSLLNTAKSHGFSPGLPQEKLTGGLGFIYS